ncbi:phage tail terminator-like protein [Ancylobacter sp.]|uniref:phage tail terminator-like protein n=1 Tax=Ancylobacter sp. TaxID=1872567 RepID=UPI003C7D293E
MASADVMKAVKLRLDGFWTLTPISYPNEVFETPIDASPYLEVQYPIANEGPASIGAPGANVQREEGVIRFVLYVERGTGVVTGTEWLDDLRRHFRNQDFGPVRTYQASPPVTDDRNADGNYWSISAAIVYEADFIG